MMSQYSNVKSTEKNDISIDQYIGFVKYGTEQDFVLNARSYKQKGDLEKYKHIKSQSKCVTASAVMKDGSKTANNIKELNGLICIDIDGQIDERLKNDKYTFIYHLSFGGDGICIFVKINPDKFEDSFNGLAQYYYDNYNITIDQACKNKNRLRYISYDPDLVHNEKSIKYVPKDIKRFLAPKNTNFIYTKSDFDNILDQIRDRNIDLCREDYHRYIRIGLALFDKFGQSGSEYFHFVCQYGSKYNKEHCDRDWKGICRNSERKCTIGTFYYYCKEAGITIYSEKTVAIINRTKIAKSQGNPDVNQIAKNIKLVNEFDCDNEDLELIKHLIDSKIDYSFGANDNKTEIEQIQDFILSTYNPKIDIITNTTYINDNVRLTDTEINDIYLTAKKNFDFTVNISDIRSIINSNLISKINVLNDFLINNKSDPKGIIEEYAKCIHPQSEYNVWAFKKWIVGALHNWTSPTYEKLVCPLTLVLTGQKHGTGKTSFLRNIMPKELDKYIVEAKINGHDKDSIHLLCSSLLVLDDEFGGKAFKDVKEYKAISDMNIITQRRPYDRESKTFKRRAILCGTTNEIDILKDVTGNRRILPISVESIDYDKVLKIDKTALIIEAYNLLKSGFEWILRTDEEINYLRLNSTQNETILPIEELFFKHYSIEKTNEFFIESVFNMSEILEFLNLRSTLKPTKYDLKEVFIKNKINYKTYRIYGTLKSGIKLYTKMDNNVQNMPNEPF